jgi:hypothetical protein
VESFTKRKKKNKKITGQMALTDAGSADAIVAFGRLRPYWLMQLRAVSPEFRAATADRLILVFPQRLSRWQDFARLCRSPQARRWLVDELGQKWRHVIPRASRSRILEHACVSGDVQLVRWLDRLNFSTEVVRARNHAALGAAVDGGSPSVVRHLVARYRLGLADLLHGRTLAHALAGRHLDVARVLLEAHDWPIEHCCRCTAAAGAGGCGLRATPAWPLVAAHFGLPSGLDERTELARGKPWWLTVHLLSAAEVQQAVVRWAGEGDLAAVKNLVCLVDETYRKTAEFDPAAAVVAAARAEFTDTAGWICAHYREQAKGRLA